MTGRKSLVGAARCSAVRAVKILGDRRLLVVGPELTGSSFQLRLRRNWN